MLRRHIFSLITLICLSAQSAFAVIGPITEEELLERSELIIHAEVTEVTCESSRRDNMSLIEYYQHTATFAVDEVIKGDMIETLTISFEMTANRPDLGSCGDESPIYWPGQKGVFYFNDISDEGDEPSYVLSWTMEDAFEIDEDSAPYVPPSREMCELPPAPVDEMMAGEEIAAGEEITAGEEIVAGEEIAAGEEIIAEDEGEEEGGCEQSRGTAPLWVMALLLMSFRSRREKTQAL